MTKNVQAWLEVAQARPSKQNVELYLDLIREEFTELMDAHADGNLAKMVDGAIDLKWVLDGYLAMLEVNIERAEEEVAKSNFSKFEDDKVIAEGSAQGYNGALGIPAYVQEVEHEEKTLYIVRRSSDNKILKPATFVEPDWNWLTPPEWM